METIHGDDVHKVAQEVLEAKKGIFRLAPNWIPRSWIRPGRRLKLAPQDIYALGASRGGICERWFASTITVSSVDAPPDEGLSYVVHKDRRFTFRDAVESKLFGIGGESYTVGSHEFYLGYAVTRQKLLCLDAGHFHPTEMISEKISSVLMFCPGLLLHVSRPVRWDSDHVVCFDDELQQVAKELVRSDQLEKVHIGLDFFDASINRVAAWVIGTRNMAKALLFAMLEPIKTIRNAELEMDFTKRLVMFEELKSLPWTSVWDYYCMKQDVPVGASWFYEIKQYEKDVLSRRG